MKARDGALDRFGLDTPLAIDRQKPFGRGRQNRAIGPAQESRERRGVGSPHHPVQIQRIEREFAAQLVGQADPNQFVVTNDLGVATDPHRAIGPIIKQDRAANFELVGTGFFIAQNALVATAKHVARDFVDRDGNATLCCAAGVLLPIGTIQLVQFL